VIAPPVPARHYLPARFRRLPAACPPSTPTRIRSPIPASRSGFPRPAPAVPRICGLPVPPGQL